MTLRIQCPTCKMVMMVPDNAQGKQARCPNGKCGQQLMVPEATGPADFAVKRTAPLPPPLQGIKVSAAAPSKKEVIPLEDPLPPPKDDVEPAPAPTPPAP